MSPALALAVALAASDPYLPGPYLAGLQTLTLPATRSTSLATDIHYPELAGGVDPAAGRCPLVAIGHGFARSRAQMAGLARHLASRGYVVLAPDFSGTDHGRNGDDLVALLDWALASEADPASFLYRRIDRTALGVSGHSAGGLAAIVAAARDPRIRALAPLDPVDSGGLGVAALASVTAPAALTWSEPSACNDSGSAETLYAATRPTRRGIGIAGANHCDPEDPSDFLCELVCGAADPDRQRRYRGLVTGWLEYWLRCDPGYEPWAFGALVLADRDAGVITFDIDGPTALACATPPAVERLLAVRRAGGLELTWDPVADPPGASEYRIYDSATADFRSPALVATAPAPPTPLAAPGAPAFLRVRARNAAGEGP